MFAAGMLAACREIPKAGRQMSATPTIRSAARFVAFGPSSMRIVRLQHEITMGRSDPNPERDRNL
ncbi:hypothetical protein BC363_26615 [Ensifer sp. LC384]|nr:hypothetical protein BC363_26615 [Ensifer sp. LC384]